MPQTLYPSAHLLELFSAWKDDEPRVIGVMRKVREMDFYHNFELPSFFHAESRRVVRDILEESGMTAITFVTPYIKPLGLSLCDLREDKRRAALAEYHAELAAESGYLGFGIPSGNDPATRNGRTP